MDSLPHLDMKRGYKNNISSVENVRENNHDQDDVINDDDTRHQYHSLPEQRPTDVTMLSNDSTSSDNVIPTHNWISLRRNLNATLEAQSKLEAAMSQLHFNKTLSFVGRNNDNSDPPLNLNVSQMISVASAKPRDSVEWKGDKPKQQKLHKVALNESLLLMPSPKANHSTEVLQNTKKLDRIKDVKHSVDWGQRKSSQKDSSRSNNELDPLSSMQSLSSSTYRSNSSQSFNIQPGNRKLSSRSESISFPERDELIAKPTHYYSNDSDNHSDQDQNEDEDETSTTTTTTSSTTTTISPDITMYDSNQSSNDFGTSDDSTNDSVGQYSRPRAKSSDLEIVSPYKTTTVNGSNPDILSRPTLNWRFTGSEWKPDDNRRGKRKHTSNNQKAYLDENILSESNVQSKPPIIRTIRFVQAHDHDLRGSHEKSEGFKTPQIWSMPRQEQTEGFSPSSFRPISRETHSFSRPNRESESHPNLDYQQLHSTLSVQQTTNNNWLSPIPGPQMSTMNSDPNKRNQFSALMREESPNQRHNELYPIREPQIWQPAKVLQAPGARPNLAQTSSLPHNNWLNNGDEAVIKNARRQVNYWPEASSIIGSHASWPSTALVLDTGALRQTLPPTTTTISPKVWISNGHNPAQHQIPPNSTPNSRPMSGPTIRAFAQFPFAHQPILNHLANPTLGGYTTNGHTIVGLHTQLQRQPKEANDLEDLTSFEQVASSPASWIYMEPHSASQLSNLFSLASTFPFHSDQMLTAIATMPASVFQAPNNKKIQTSSTHVSSTTARPVKARTTEQANQIINQPQNNNHGSSQVIGSFIPLADPSSLSDAFGWPMGLGSEATRSLIKMNHVAPPPSYLIPIHTRPIALKTAPNFRDTQYQTLTTDQVPTRANFESLLQDNVRQQAYVPTSMDSPWFDSNSPSMSFESYAHYPGAPIWHPIQAQYLNEFQHGGAGSAKVNMENQDQSDTQNKNQSFRSRIASRSKLWPRLRKLNNITANSNRRNSKTFITFLDLGETKRRLNLINRSPRYKRGIMDSVTNLVRFPWRKSKDEGDKDKLMAVESQTHVQFVAPPKSISGLSQLHLSKSNTQDKHPLGISLLELPASSSELNASFNHIKQPFSPVSIKGGYRARAAYIPLIDQHNLMSTIKLSSEPAALAQALKIHRHYQNHLSNFNESPLELMNEAETAGSAQDSGYPAIRVPLSQPSLLTTGDNPLYLTKGSSLAQTNLNQMLQSASTHNQNSIFYTPIESDIPLEPPANEPQRSASNKNTAASKSRDRIKNLLKSSRKPLDKLMRFSRLPLSSNSQTSGLSNVSAASSDLHASISFARPPGLDLKHSGMSIAQTFGSLVSPSIMQTSVPNPSSSLDNFNRFALPLQNWYQEQMKLSQSDTTRHMKVVGKQTHNSLLPLSNHISQGYSPYTFITANPQTSSIFPHESSKNEIFRPPKITHQQVLTLLANRSSPLNQVHFSGTSQHSSTGGYSRGSQRIDVNPWSLLSKPISMLQSLSRSRGSTSRNNTISPFPYLSVKRSNSFALNSYPRSIHIAPRNLISNQTIGLRRPLRPTTWQEEAATNMFNDVHYNNKLKLDQNLYPQSRHYVGPDQQHETYGEILLNDPSILPNRNQAQSDVFSTSSSNQRPTKINPTILEQQVEVNSGSDLHGSQFSNVMNSNILANDPQSGTILSDFSSHNRPSNEGGDIDQQVFIRDSTSPLTTSQDDTQFPDHLQIQSQNMDTFNPFLVGPIEQPNKQLKLIKFIPGINQMANKFRQHLFQTFKLNPLASVVKRPQQKLPLSYMMNAQIPHQFETYSAQPTKLNGVTHSEHQYIPFTKANLPETMSNSLELHIDNANPSFENNVLHTRNLTSHIQSSHNNQDGQVYMAPVSGVLRQTHDQTLNIQDSREQGMNDYIFAPEAMIKSLSPNHTLSMSNIPQTIENERGINFQTYTRQPDGHGLSASNYSGKSTEDKITIIRPLNTSKNGQIMTEVDGNLITSDGSYIGEDDRDLSRPQGTQAHENWQLQTASSHEQNQIKYKPKDKNYTIHHHHHLVTVDDSNQIRDQIQLEEQPESGQQYVKNQTFTTLPDGSIVMNYVSKQTNNGYTRVPVEPQPDPDQQVVEVRYELQRPMSQTTMNRSQEQMNPQRLFNRTRSNHTSTIMLSPSSNRTSVPSEMNRNNERVPYLDYQVIKATNGPQQKLVYVREETRPDLKEGTQSVTPIEPSDVDYQNAGPPELGSPNSEISEDEQQEQANGQRKQIVYEPEVGYQAGGIIYGHHAPGGDNQSSQETNESQEVQEVQGHETNNETENKVDHLNQLHHNANNNFTRSANAQYKRIIPDQRMSKIPNGLSSNQPKTFSRVGSQNVNESPKNDRPTYSDSFEDKQASSIDQQSEEEPVIFVSTKPQKIVQMRKQPEKVTKDSAPRLRFKADSIGAIRIKGNSTNLLDSRRTVLAASTAAGSSLSFHVVANRNGSFTTKKPSQLKGDLMNITRDSLTTTRSPKAKIRWQGVAGPNKLTSSKGNSTIVTSKWNDMDGIASAETTRSEQKQAWLVGGMTHQAYGSTNISQISPTTLASSDLTPSNNDSSNHHNNATSTNSHEIGINLPAQNGPHTWRLNRHQPLNSTSYSSAMGPIQTFKTNKKSSTTNMTNDPTTTTTTTTRKPITNIEPSNHKLTNTFQNYSDSRTAPTSFRLDSSGSNNNLGVRSTTSTTPQSMQLAEPTDTPKLSATTSESILAQASHNHIFHEDTGPQMVSDITNSSMGLDESMKQHSEQSKRSADDDDRYHLHYVDDKDQNQTELMRPRSSGRPSKDDIETTLYNEKSSDNLSLITRRHNEDR